MKKIPKPTVCRTEEAETRSPPGYYASAHATDDNANDISAIAARTTKAVNTGNRETDTENAKYNNDIFDALTKLAGEGSRWKCVRALGANLKNDSIFYTLQGGNYYCITFRNLWASWKEFNREYNIKDSTVAAKLQEPGFQNTPRNPVTIVAAADFHPDPVKDYCLDPC